MDLEQAHTNMIKQQIRTCDVFDEHILAAINDTPREYFVPAQIKNLAYTDMPIGIDRGQTMLCPKEEAQMLQALAITPDDHVLEIGTGSGYITTLLARLAKKVTSVDIFADFTRQAQTRLQHFDIDNVTLATGNAATGWSAEAPYDVIIVSGAVPRIPAELVPQLNIGGRLFVFVGDAPAMNACLLTQTAANIWDTQRIFETVVPRLLKIHEPSPFIF